MLNKSSTQSPQTPSVKSSLHSTTLLMKPENNTPLIKSNLTRQSVISNSYLLTPPKSVSTTSTWEKQRQQMMTNNTPIRPSSTQTTSSQYRSRVMMMTPSLSPPPSTKPASHIARANMNTTPSGFNAPPKPPRRFSLKINH